MGVQWEQSPGRSMPESTHPAPQLTWASPWAFLQLVTGHTHIVSWLTRVPALSSHLDTPQWILAGTSCYP